MESLAGIRRPLPHIGIVAPPRCEDRAQHSGRAVKRICPRNQVGRGFVKPGGTERTSRAETQERCGTESLSAEIADRFRHWLLVPPAFLELSAATGARRGEVLALRWSDIQDGAVSISRSLSQTRAGLVFKETKNQSSRLVVLPSSAVKSLDVHREAQKIFRDQFSSAYNIELDLIFAEPDGAPLKPNSISASVSALFKRLKIPKPKGASLHLLRHSHGSHLLAAGMELPAVSERLGHSSVMVTATVYSHRLTGRDQEAANRWEKFQKSDEQPERKQ